MYSLSLFKILAYFFSKIMHVQTAITKHTIKVQNPISFDTKSFPINGKKLNMAPVQNRKMTPNKTPKISFLFVIFIKVFSFQNLVHKTLYLSDFFS